MVVSKREQASVTVLHDEFARVPAGVRESPRELDTPAGKFGIERIRILYEQVCGKQFVRVFARIRRRRFGATEVDSLVITRDDGVNRRILPRAETVKPKFVLVVG